MPEELVKLVVGVMGYAAEMELKSIKKRTAEGREVARNMGSSSDGSGLTRPSRRQQCSKCGSEAIERNHCFCNGNDGLHDSPHPSAAKGDRLMLLKDAFSRLHLSAG